MQCRNTSIESSNLGGRPLDLRYGPKARRGKPMRRQSNSSIGQGSLSSLTASGTHTGSYPSHSLYTQSSASTFGMVSVSLCAFRKHVLIVCLSPVFLPNAIKKHHQVCLASAPAHMVGLIFCHGKSQLVFQIISKQLEMHCRARILHYPRFQGFTPVASRMSIH